MFVIYSHIVSDGGLKLAFESGRALLTVTAGVIYQLYGTKIVTPRIKWDQEVNRSF